MPPQDRSQRISSSLLSTENPQEDGRNFLVDLRVGLSLGSQTVNTPMDRLSSTHLIMIHSQEVAPPKDKNGSLETMLELFQRRTIGRSTTFLVGIPTELHLQGAVK